MQGAVECVVEAVGGVWGAARVARSAARAGFVMEFESALAADTGLEDGEGVRVASLAAGSLLVTYAARVRAGEGGG